jgi:hypothetical protein
MSYVITATGKERTNGRPMKLSAEAPTQTLAEAYLRAKLAVTVINLKKISITEKVSGAGLAAWTTSAAVEFSDALLGLKKEINGEDQTRQLPLQNINNGLALTLPDGTTNGTININNGLISAIGTAFVDGNGETGWTVYTGKYVK